MSMELDILWSGGLTATVGLVGWILKYYAGEVQRLQILLNRTREEMAKEYVTKTEVHYDMSRVMDRLDALDSKIDRLIEGR
jgi:hypothetical protein